MKMKTTVAVTVGLVLAGVVCVWVGGETRPPTADPQETAAIAASINDFAWRLYGRLAEESGNLFFSPASVHTALTMTYAGARGQTAGQMFDVLSLPAEGGPQPSAAATRPAGTHPSVSPWPQERIHRACGWLLRELRAGRRKGHEIHIANALWGQRGYRWQAEFLNVTRAHYGAALHAVDFAKAAEEARNTINAWAERQTRDKIKELIPRDVLTKLTTLVLTNAIYFKGDWASQFRRGRTREADFRVSAERTVRVAMMNQKGKFGYAETDLAQVLRMPYVGEAMSMVIFLPKDPDGLAALEKQLAEAGPDAALKRLRKQEVSVSVPKFRLTWGAELRETLQSMGMTDAFVYRRADFSGMDGTRELFISHVIHKAFVDVNEEGTEAAAATAVVAAKAKVMLRTFLADHPFVFLIRDETTGAILFLGRVVDPS